MKGDKKRKRKRTHFTVRKRKIVTRATTRALKTPPSLVKISKRPKGRYVNLRTCMNMNAEEYIEFRNFGKEMIEKYCEVKLGFNQQDETAKKNCLDEIFNHYPTLVREKDQWVAEDLLKTALINKRQYLYKKEQKRRHKSSLSDVEMNNDTDDMSIVTDEKTDENDSSKSTTPTRPITTFPKKAERSLLSQIFEEREDKTRLEDFTRGKESETDQEVEASHDENEMMCSEDDKESKKKRVRPISFTNLGQKFVKKRTES